LTYSLLFLSFGILKSQTSFSFEGLTLKDTSKVLLYSKKVEARRHNHQERITWGESLLAWSESIHFKKGICIGLVQIGYGEDGKQNIDKAIVYYYKALAIANEIQAISEIISLNNYLGIIYSSQGQHKKAIYHFRKMHELGIKTKNAYAVGVGANNIGVEYLQSKQPVLALFYFNKCLKVFASSQKHTALTEIYSNMIDANVALGELDSAKRYVDKALAEVQLSNYKAFDVITVSLAVGKYYAAIKEFNKAELYLSRVLKEMPEPDYMFFRDAAKGLTYIYEQQNNTEKAYAMFKLQMRYNDTILGEERLKKTADAESKFNNLKWEYELQKEKNTVITKSVQLRKNKTILILVSSLALVLFAALFFIYRLFRDKRKANHQLAEQKKEILDSIHYSKRIQSGILPSEQILKSVMGDHFVFFKPKDIVSGDFYWVSPSDENTFFVACCDCTGHGVPGAFMSLLGYSLLSKVEEMHENNSPAQILNYINTHLPDYFKVESDDGSIKDGMDMSLCKINRKTGEVVFAGANNSIYHITEKELHVIKAQKQAISADKKIYKRDFENISFQVSKGDWVILFTDGYADQFGGPKGKKFKYKQLEDLLFSNKFNATKDMHQQLEQRLSEWKGGLEQVDDVCIIGLKI
jgi:serine phosphatase RsbU (regulator of sigma subunit)